MNYDVSLSNGRCIRLYNHTGDTIHAINHAGHEIQICADIVTSSSIVIYVVLTYCATETSQKRKFKMHIAVFQTQVFLFYFLHT